MLKNSVEGVSCPDNINSMYCLLSGHETPPWSFSTQLKSTVHVHADVS